MALIFKVFAGDEIKQFNVFFAYGAIFYHQWQVGKFKPGQVGNIILCLWL
ncbi:hypothetical protein [Mucilaginibacter sp. R-33]